jgi:hypothetical protein
MPNPLELTTLNASTRPSPPLRESVVVFVDVLFSPMSGGEPSGMCISLGTIDMHIDRRPFPGQPISLPTMGENCLDT